MCVHSPPSPAFRLHHTPPSSFFPASLFSPSPAPRVPPLPVISPSSLPLALGRFREGSLQHCPVCDRGSHGRRLASQPRALRPQGKRLPLREMTVMRIALSTRGTACTCCTELEAFFGAIQTLLMPANGLFSHTCTCLLLCSAEFAASGTW